MGTKRQKYKDGQKYGILEYKVDMREELTSIFQ